MGAIPDTSNVVYDELRKTIDTALAYGKESRSVEFKRGANWDELKRNIIKTCLGMANLRGGGLIIIGAEEDGTSLRLSGVSNEQLCTYDPDIIKEQVDSYASPSIDLDIVRHNVDKIIFIAIKVFEFSRQIIICKKSMEEGSHKLRDGAIYTRPSGNARTEEVRNAGVMRDLLELATVKEARRLIEVTKNLGINIVTQGDIADKDKYIAERGDLE
ncbi:MAG: ATP-binding protein [Sedimentisphaerales bacterium]|nr:ATP-binding protein [Sedimentisphaerales bacterium]